MLIQKTQEHNSITHKSRFSRRMIQLLPQHTAYPTPVDQKESTAPLNTPTVTADWSTPTARQRCESLLDKSTVNLSRARHIIDSRRPGWLMQLKILCSHLLYCVFSHKSSEYM